MTTAAIDLSRAAYGFIPVSYNPGPDAVRFARHELILRKEPKGRGLIPTSLNRAPLTLRRGTRVAAVEQQGDWWLVQSPGRMLGWVRADELSTAQPYTPD